MGEFLCAVGENRHFSDGGICPGAELYTSQSPDAFFRHHRKHLSYCCFSTFFRPISALAVPRSTPYRINSGGPGSSGKALRGRVKPSCQNEEVQTGDAQEKSSLDALVTVELADHAFTGT